MSIEINGAAILAAMAKNPDAFAMTKAEIDSIAEDAVFAKLREKNLKLEALCKLAGTLGSQDFRKLVGNLPDKDAKALAKLDAKHPDFKAADANWHRAQIIKLGEREVEPHVPQKAAKVSRSPAPRPRAGVPKIGPIMGSEAIAAGMEPKKRTRSSKPKSDNQH